MKGIDEEQEPKTPNRAQWQTLAKAGTAMPVQLELIDADYNVLFSNRGPTRGLKCHRSINDRDEMCSDCGMDVAIKSGSPSTQSFEEDGRRIDIFYVPVLDQEDEARSVLRLQFEYPHHPSLEEALESILKTNMKLHHLTSIIRHDMLNQLTAMMGYLDLYDEMPDKRDMLISRMKDLVLNLDRQATFTRSYQKLGSTAPGWQDLEQCIIVAMEELDMDPRTVEVESPLPLVFGDPLLEKVVVNIFSNSLRHGGDVRRIKVWFREGQGVGSLYFSDNGRGIPADKKERIFDRGYGSNRGYGLFLVRSILEINDITIQEVGVEGQGACFRLDLPPQVYKPKNRGGEVK